MVDVKFRPSLPAAEPPKIMLNGLSGSGRTTTALRIAQGLAPGGRIGLIDTQRGHSRALAKEYAFEVLEIHRDFAPKRLAEAIAVAAHAEFDVLIIDNGSPFWSGPGGFKDTADRIRNEGRNGWAEVRPQEAGLVDALSTFDRPLIMNLNVRDEWVTTTDPDTGKPTRARIGLEPDFLGRIDTMWHLIGHLHNQTMTVTKSRYEGLPVREVLTEPGEDIGKIIKAAFDAATPLPSWRHYRDAAAAPTATYADVIKIHAQVAEHGLEGAVFLDEDGDLAVLLQWLRNRAKALLQQQARDRQAEQHRPEE